MIFTEEEFASVQTPLLTTARTHVSCVSVPPLEPGKLVLVLLMSLTPEEKFADVDFCHFTTAPTFPLKVKPEGWLPLQIV